ncbi:MAG: beta-ketoacyl-[acyl-carrier-protein] synthase family protein [Planctomycetes bacterium]|nr:beta-ketoacyl-[acyl-carrier-protein] synthase family protein [Planctomycetota bacterium]
MNPLIVACSANTPYGPGLRKCWEGLMEGRSGIRPVERFGEGQFISDYAALVPDIPMKTGNRLMELLGPVLENLPNPLPPEIPLFLATTTGQIDLLEQSVEKGSGQIESSSPLRLLDELRQLTGIRGPARVVSCACASSTAAVARAASEVQAGHAETALVVGCDAVSEFVYAGFSTLMAMSPQPARPFDRDRDGLTVGEAAAATFVMNPSQAGAGKYQPLAEVLGWGYTNDANHMTGPSRDGKGLKRAIEIALDMAACAPEDLAFVNAHGTGTVYNDAMEMKALRQVFGNNPKPVYSIKGGTGHTMGAAGLLEILLTAESLKEAIIPSTVGMDEPDERAQGWVKTEHVSVPANRPALSINSGFGGVNVAVVLQKTP